MALEPDLLKWDYERTHATLAMLTEVRFKLLAFVPTITGFGIATIAERPLSAALPLGVIGFVATLGVTLYDVRNSKLYNSAMHRLKMLERRLALPVLTRGQAHGGHMNERPSASVRLFGLLAKHDRALSYIYGVALAGWLYVTIRAVAPAVGNPAGCVLNLVMPVIVGVATIGSLRAIDDDEASKPRPVDEDTCIRLVTRWPGPRGSPEKA